MDSFTTGTFVKNNILVEVLGSNSAYRYRWLKQLDNTVPVTIDYSKFLPILIVDYSASMHQSNSARPATDATKNVLSQLFNKGFTEVLLVYFGRTAYRFSVNKNNYAFQIDEVLQNYFTNPQAFAFYGKFKTDATVPTIGFQDAYNYFIKSGHIGAYITFMTDGGFNNFDTNYYGVEWRRIADAFSTLGKQVSISCIGYMNDQVANIKQMKENFDKSNIELSYVTIKLSSEIQKAMEESFENFDVNMTAKLQLCSTIILTQDEPVYSKDKLFDVLTPLNIIENAVKNTGVSEEWIKKVIMFEIEIGLRETGVMENLNIISKMSYGQKDKYKEIVMSLVPYFGNGQKKYLELKAMYKSLKTRDIYAWRSLNEKLGSLGKLLRDVQILISDELNEKKSFEIATKITNSVSSRHMRTLQRRKITNELNQKGKQFDISVGVNSEPLTVNCKLVDTMGNEKNVSEQLITKLGDLNEYYTCSYSLEDWENMLNTCLGVSMQYVWKEGDDWSPSRSFIESVSGSSFVSIQGYTDMQNIFGGVVNTPEHEKLYGNNKYVMSAHDKGNGFIPVAVDPFFIHKLQIVRERLGHMIAGSSLTFRNSHVLFYVAVIKQCFNQLLDSNTERMRHVIMLLLNTFRILTDKLNTIFDKDQAPLHKCDIIYNIAIGNTAPYLFNSAWESAIFVLTASDTQMNNGFEKYMKEKDLDNTQMTILEFKKRVWEMVLRHWLIVAFKNNEVWESPTTWGIMDAKSIEEKLKIEGPEALTKYFMNESKVLTVPEKIQTDLHDLRNTKLLKLFKSIVMWSECLNDSVWTNFNKSFMPLPISQLTTELTNHFNNDQLLDEYNYWTYWECFAYGQKDCYPSRSHAEVSKVVANNINSKYGENLTGMLADVRELLEFRKRKYETRYLPVTFSTDQQNRINELFGKVYNKQVQLNEFKIAVRNILGNYYGEIFDQVSNTDHIDVLLNLYVYCQSHNHSIFVKPESRLPRSCPANPASSIFLQKLDDIEFSKYFKPLGFGWTTKKYRSWVDDLHTFMTNLLMTTVSENEFVQNVMTHVKSYKPLEDNEVDIYVNEFKHFYSQFKGSNEITSLMANVGGQDVSLANISGGSTKNLSYYF